MLTEEDCKLYARWWYQCCVDGDWHTKQIAGLRPDALGQYVADMVATRAKDEAEIIQELNRGDIGRVQDRAELALIEDGRSEDVDEDSVAFRRLCAYMLRGSLEATRKAKAEEAGDFAYETRDPLFKTLPPAATDADLGGAPTVALVAASDVAAPSGPSIASLVEPFITKKATKARVSEKTQNDYRVSLALFMQVVGRDRQVAAITGNEVVAFKNLLEECPSNFRKRLHTDDLREAIRLNAERPQTERLDTLDPKTINEKYLSNVKTFFDWVRGEKHIKESPAIGVRALMPAGRDAVDERDPFSVDDLRRIFAAPSFVDTSLMDRNHEFWAPLIGLFTGCRLNEIGQLNTADIVEMNGMPHFRICEQDDDQHLKSAAAKRWIPVHSELMSLGFLDYVEATGGGRLFPDWGLSEDGYYSSSFSKRFSRFLKTINVKTDKKTFHSFRHSFADALDEVVEEGVRDIFMGHASGHVRRRYGSKPPKQAWSEAFQKLAYPRLDLSHLRP